MSDTMKVKGGKGGKRKGRENRRKEGEVCSLVVEATGNTELCLWLIEGENGRKVIWWTYKRLSLS